jgi:hypothetical protein
MPMVARWSGKSLITMVCETFLVRSCSTCQRVKNEGWVDHSSRSSIIAQRGAFEDVPIELARPILDKEVEESPLAPHTRN